MSKPEICPQGEYDGACYLYGVVNVYVALTGKKPTFKMWDKSIEHIPFRNDFLCNVGTEWYDDDMHLYVMSMNRMLETISNGKFKFKITPYQNIGNGKQLIGLIDKHSVIILNIDSKHWVVGVDYDENNIYLADSYQLALNGLKYWENKSENYERYYNRCINLHDISWLYNPSVIQINCITRR